MNLKEKIIIWSKEQTFESIFSWIMIILTFMFFIDAFFILPLEPTRYGWTNEAMEMAFKTLVLGCCFMFMHNFKEIKRK